MRNLSFKAAAILLVIAAKADASILYSTTDLGAGYQLQTNPGGQTYGVANATGSTIYDFDKSPVTPIDVYTDYSGGAGDNYSRLTMQSGKFRVGYFYTFEPPINGMYSPSFLDAGAGWVTWTPNPVLDLNTSGQVVGTSLAPAGGSIHNSFYAAFSDPNGNSHGGISPTSDNLNNYIATIPGVSLTSAFKIDDLGRILADGSNGDVYLLTPVALGAASTVPEPTALLNLSLAGICLVFYRIRSKR